MVIIIFACVDFGWSRRGMLSTHHYKRTDLTLVYPASWMNMQYQFTVKGSSYCIGTFPMNICESNAGMNEDNSMETIYWKTIGSRYASHLARLNCDG